MIRIGSIKTSHYPIAVLRVSGQQAQGQQVVGLAAAHGLLQFKDALIAFALQTPEGMFQKGSHALGDVVLLKEGGRVDAIFNEIRKIEDGIPALRVKDAFARRA